MMLFKVKIQILTIWIGIISFLISRTTSSMIIPEKAFPASQGTKQYRTLTGCKYR